MKKLPILFAAALMACQPGMGSTPRTHLEANAWPSVREFSASFGINLAYRQIDLEIPIYDETEHSVLYRLICRGGDDRYRAELSQRGLFSYLRDLTCVLNLGNIESNLSLISSGQSVAYLSRGYFDQRHLIGACATYPEFGLSRNFRLRGFVLTIDLSNLQFASTVAQQSSDTGEIANGRPVEYALVSVSVRRDLTARTARAEQPGYLDPKGNEVACRTIRRGIEPRMCRNSETLSWEECPPDWEYRREDHEQ